ncbi:MAG TPA: condensation domain-containing protein, partial [Pyrinomonadaceae bacterium]|nr:condensation domain-containing protein [Pyrinomonadaceae bacterium]
MTQIPLGEDLEESGRYQVGPDAAEEVYVFPASFAQQRLWFLDRLEPGSPLYNITTALHLRGRLDAEALGRALTEVVRRHEVLRTTFAEQDGLPVQVVWPPKPLPLEFEELGHLPPEEREARCGGACEEEGRRAFDLERGPLVRARLLRLKEEEHVLVLTMHHIISDAWSLDVLEREVRALYAAYARGEESPLDEPPIQYGDYAVWQKDWLQGEVLATELSYWRTQLGGELPLLELPIDKPRPPVRTYQGAKLGFLVEDGLGRRLQELSRKEGCTLFMTLLAAFDALLYRYTGQEDIVVGSPVAGRNRAELEPLVGFFVNTLVLRTDLSGEPTFAELMRRVREVSLGAYAHQEVPFEKLVEELQPERDLSRSPLFQVMFALQTVSPSSSQSPADAAGRVWRMGGKGETAKFDLTLSLAEGGGRLLGAVEYNTDLFEEPTAVRLAEHFLNLARSA